MRFAHIFQQVHHQPWLATADTWASVAAVLERKMAGADLPDDFFGTQRREMEMDGQGVAHIHILGPLGQHLSGMEKSCGCTDYGDIEQEVYAAIDQGARGLFFRVSSGGGACAGCDEAARVIASVPLPKAAHTDSLMGSAAYALAVGCDTIHCTGSAIVGSIGTILPWVDTAQAWAARGLKFAPIVSDGADLKATMHGPSLTAEQEAHVRELGNDYAALFVAHVRAHREPSEEVFRGGAYVGTRALEYGLVDGLCSEAEALQTLYARL